MRMARQTWDGRTTASMSANDNHALLGHLYKAEYNGNDTPNDLEREVMRSEAIRNSSSALEAGLMCFYSRVMNKL